MFQVEGDLAGQLKSISRDFDENYQISAYDRLTIDVYTHNGERLIDPDLLLNETGRNNQWQNQRVVEYLVFKDGTVKLPVIGTVNLEGKTIAEAQNILSEKYATFYKDAYVLVRYNNKRVIVLGAPGGIVVPLENENMNLLEVLALAGGLDNDARANNIRLIRGNLNAPQVQIIDLSTLEGMIKANLRMESGDVVYIEPVRRPIPESIRDIAPVLGLLTGIISFIALFRTF
jgi:polysaccharide export outer membrane protein